MRILINAISAKTGGIVTYTSNLIAALEQRGVDFLVAVPNSFPDAPHLLRMAASNYPPLRRLAWEQTSWRKHVLRNKPDVLFSSANFGLLNCPVPQVLLIREGGLFDPLYLSTVAAAQGLGAALQRYLRRSLILLSAHANDHIITPTQSMRELLLKWAPDLAERCDVNSYGTLVDTFSAENKRPWRQDGTLRAFYVSVYYPHKNPADAVMACEKLSASGLPISLRLTMDMEAIEKCRGSARDSYHVRRGIATGLAKMGMIDYGDLPKTYAEHDIFLFPSISETFGHPMIEALASGLPIVASDVPVNREVLGDAALYYQPYRPSELADRIQELDRNPALRDHLTAKSQERARLFFSWDDHVDRLLALFDTITTQSRRKP